MTPPRSQRPQARDWQPQTLGGTGPGTPHTASREVEVATCCPWLPVLGQSQPDKEPGPDTPDGPTAGTSLGSPPGQFDLTASVERNRPVIDESALRSKPASNGLRRMGAVHTEIRVELVARIMLLRGGLFLHGRCPTRPGTIAGTRSGPFGPGSERHLLSYPSIRAATRTIDCLTTQT